MSTTGQKHILLLQGKKIIRCCIENILCIKSSSNECLLCELRHYPTPQVHRFASGYGLTHFKNQISDPHFFEIKQGTLFNTRFYESMTLDRIITSSVASIMTDPPPLVVSRKELKAFKAHVVLR